MRKFFVGVALACALLSGALAAPAAAQTNFEGVWALDKSKSVDIPREWNNADSLKIYVRQDARQLTIEDKGAAKEAAAERKAAAAAAAA